MPRPLAAVISLGCSKNQVDSQIMATQLVEMGYALTADQSKASLIVVNTCGFLQSAVEESVDTILEVSRWKKEGSCIRLVVAGCMVQRYGRKLPAVLPEVDCFLGTAHIHRLNEIVGGGAEGLDCSRVLISRPREVLRELGSCRVSEGSPASVYLRIADGCNNRCSFCMIPRLRGPLRSRPVQAILEEAKMLVQAGAVEINLIAQDITAFESERGGRRALIALLEGLEPLAGLQWIRLLYAYPEGITGDLLACVRDSDKIVPYLDIPLQHCVPHILRGMRGRTPLVESQALVDRIRSAVPDIALRTTLMVGFPGETERDFESLLAFVRDTHFDHLGVFAFSPEPGTGAARLPSQVPDGERERRRHGLLAAQAEISRRLLARQVGKSLPVLVEGYHPETDLLLTGRLKSQAPEVDGAVLITAGMATVGQIIPVRITKSHTYDLEAEVLFGEEGICGTRLPQSPGIKTL
ncbi:MAG: 30S ribosomal protein S12 methylthiotransferase RimO [Syntrophobacteraceae bacterium]|jgi:ribosomal protein S12 methylthiotransferase|nr:30S ribosomal protein S12 methylthiotransferase RimO [Syntrophobacteraceae bacterium]